MKPLRAGACVCAMALLMLETATALANPAAQPPPPPAAGAGAGPAIRRAANMLDGAPAFDVIDINGRRASRIECIWSGWYEADAMATRLLASTAVMAAVIAKNGRIGITDLGPAIFDCAVERGAESAEGPR